MQVALVGDCELLSRGFAGLLAPYEGRVGVLEAKALGRPGIHVDIALFDAFSLEAWDGSVRSLVQTPNVGKVAVYTWRLVPSLVLEAIKRGAAGVISKSLEGDALVDAVEAIHRGERVITGGVDVDEPHQALGLTPREYDIVSLIVQGLSNAEIAATTYLSINSVKSYIRSAYRAMEVTSRSQAILWGLDHGMLAAGPRRLMD